LCWGIDIWINNAMTITFAPFIEISPADFKWATEVTYLGYVCGTLAAPLPPIFQPEVAAQAIVWAAHHRRREIYVGFSGQRAIWANKFTPDLLDRYPARTGYRGQQSHEPVKPNRPDNLWTSVPGDFSAHGRFDRQARPYSVQLWLNLHRGWVTLIGLGMAVFAFTAMLWLLGK
jgi:hypothetical protein